MLRNAIANTISRICNPQRKRRRQRNQQPSDAQQLEQRTLLTGNVAASFANGTLTLTSDSTDNEVSVAVRVGGPANTFEVFGAGGTKINGLDSFVVSGVNPLTAIKNVKLDFKGGDDVFRSFLPFTGNVTANMGPGADTYDAQSVLGGGKNLKLDLGSAPSDGIDVATVVGPVTGNATIQGGTGTQQVSFVLADVAKNVKVNLGSSRVTGSADPLADEFSLSRSEVGGSLTVKGSDGSQRAIVAESTVGKNVNFNLGDDPDAAVITGLVDQQNQVRIRGNVNAKMGAGQDFFFMSGIDVTPDVRIDGNLKVDMGAGIDSSPEAMLVEGTVGKNASLKGGNGQQSVATNALSVGRNLSVKLGAGDDTLVVAQPPIVGGRFRADGGSGLDTIDPAGLIDFVNFDTVLL
jgi:hypothetical protein